MQAVSFSVRAATALLAALLLLAAPAHATNARKAAVDTGAPSIHLRYKETNASTFYSEVTVKRSAPGTYFAVTGWHNGYFGLQEGNNGKKVLIFSVWGSKNDNPASIARHLAVKLIQKDPEVRTGEFGNEGSGMQSFLDYDWKPNTTYAFMVKAKMVDDRAEYSGYFRAPDSKRWRHLVTMSTPHDASLLKGLHSFAEDFRRDESSAREVRRATFSNAWARRQDGGTIRLLTAMVTSYPSNARALDAEVSALGITIATGGHTENKTTSLGVRIDRPASINDDLPGDL
jgi:hypothetical protein